ncbi:MAG: AI-2E family transporter [Candidatus Magasanikbacteria bacterium]|nr:AI-2E family transporter [Candidatus Magasanikbacteria bacterium]
MDFSKIRNYLFLGLLLLVTIVFIYTIRPFAYPIFWAAVLATLFYPFYQRLERVVRHPNISASIILIFVTIIILLPLTILGTLFVKESLGVYEALNDNQGQISASIQQITGLLHNNPYLPTFKINDAVITEKITEFGRIVVSSIFNVAKNLTQNSLEFIAFFIITLYTLFFFVRDGEKILKKLMYLSPLGDRYETMLYAKFTATTSATIKGVLLISVVQGSLGGALFAITGIHSALIWGILMAALSVIPVTGAFLVWLPAGVITLLTGHVWQGIVILVVGVLIISTIDNLLRPVLVGKNLRIHPLLILFSTLGGLVLFGISGFVIGPIVASLFLSFWEMYEEYYRQELSRN